jgi:hypothetical protein
MSADMIMDNNAIRVVGGWSRDGSDDLKPVLQIALNHHCECVGYAVRDGALLIFWAMQPGVTPLVAPCRRLDSLHRTVVEWLEANKAPSELRDGDTDEEQGAFEASTNQWGHGGGDPYAMLAIKPRTRWLGK